MKYILTVLFIFLFISINAQVNIRKEKKEITSVLMAQKEAWNNGDIEGYMAGYWNSDSLKFIGQSGITYGWKNTLENYRKHYSNRALMGKLEFSIVQIDVFRDNSAFMIGKWKLLREKDTPQGFFTLLWKKINKKWKVVVDHSS